ncbi:MAG: MarR family winged helix-turn-helix transcriptional regulator [Trebonia sp.]
MTSAAKGTAPGADGLAIAGPDYSPGFWLWHATLRWQREVAAALAPLGLTHVQFVLLSCAWWLNDHGVVPNQLQLARQAGADVKMTSQVLRKLEAKCLIGRETDRDDTRAKRLRITEAGIALALDAIERVEKADRAFFRPLTSTGIPSAEITALLRRLAERPVDT